GFSIGGGGVG
uniref:Sperm-activating peptide (Ser-3, Ile-4, Gly-5 SAP-I) n=1 Tax=Tripneustes gratilla TaxID=7673 RepID=Q7M3T6_TRIGR|nr:sperm-activating peptide I (3-Asn,4-Ile,5-Gly) [Tripneustes gratilla]